MSDVLLESLEAGVVTLTMNRPERLNAMTHEMLERMLDAVSRAAADPAVGCVVLTGAGRAFCAGGDVKAMASGRDDELTLEGRAGPLRQRMEVSRLLHDMAKPTVAMIPGPAAGAGLSLALACDFRVASENAKLTTAFAKVGLSGDFGGTWFLTQLLGSARAKELYLTSPVLSADEAQRLGLVTKVVPEDVLLPETMKLAQGLADGPRITLGYIKRNINAAEVESLASVLDREALHHARSSMTEDHKEAAQAFVEKRKPVFKGR